jgi:hypothetical protein
MTFSSVRDVVYPFNMQVQPTSDREHGGTGRAPDIPAIDIAYIFGSSCVACTLALIHGPRKIHKVATKCVLGVGCVEKNSW